MQEQKNIDLGINFSQAKHRALTAATKYLQGVTLTGDPDGRYHGEKGRRRADKLSLYLQQVADVDHSSLLALFIAVLGKPDAGFWGWAPGRSSRLGGLIAEEWIQGEESYELDLHTLSSKVFSAVTLAAMRADSDNRKIIPNGELSWSVFDKIRAVRVFLQLTLESPAFQADRAEIQHSAQRLQQLLDNDKITTIRLDYLPSKIRAKLFSEGAFIGAFSQNRREMKEGKKDEKKLSGLPLSGLPPEVLAHASLFLSKIDTVKSLLVNDAAVRNAKQYEREGRPGDAKAIADAASAAPAPAAQRK